MTSFSSFRFTGNVSCTSDHNTGFYFCQLKVTRAMYVCRCLIRRSFGAARKSLLAHKPRVKFSVEFLSFSCFYVVFDQELLFVGSRTVLCQFRIITVLNVDAIIQFKRQFSRRRTTTKKCDVNFYAATSRDGYSSKSNDRRMCLNMCDRDSWCNLQDLLVFHSMSCSLISRCLIK